MAGVRLADRKPVCSSEGKPGYRTFAADSREMACPAAWFAGCARTDRREAGHFQFDRNVLPASCRSFTTTLKRIAWHAEQAS